MNTAKECRSMLVAKVRVHKSEHTGRLKCMLRAGERARSTSQRLEPGGAIDWDIYSCQEQARRNIRALQTRKQASTVCTLSFVSSRVRSTSSIGMRSVGQRESLYSLMGLQIRPCSREVVFTVLANAARVPNL